VLTDSITTNTALIRATGFHWKLDEGKTIKSRKERWKNVKDRKVCDTL
jgi:hypothetical protein